MLSARRVSRVMEKGDLPFRCILDQLILQPLYLAPIHVIAVQYVKGNIPLLESIVFFASHIEEGIKALIRFIVVTERSVEFDLTVQQSLVDVLKFDLEIVWSFATVNVVARNNIVPAVIAVQIASAVIRRLRLIGPAVTS